MDPRQQAQEQMDAARAAFEEATSRQRSILGTLIKADLRAKRELVDGVREVLNREIARCEASETEKAAS